MLVPPRLPALQAAVEALVSASQQQMAVDHSIEVPTEDTTAGKEMYAAVAEETVTQQVGLVDSTTELVAAEDKYVSTEDEADEYVDTSTGQEQSVEQ